MEQLLLKGYDNEQQTLKAAYPTVSGTFNNNKIISFQDYKGSKATDIFAADIFAADTFQVNKPIIDKNYTETKKAEHNPVDAYTKEEIKIMLQYLLNTPSRYGHTNLRNYLYITLSVNIARRAGDMLKLRVSDVIDEKGYIKKHIYFHEQKTGKYTKVLINTYCQEALKKYFDKIGTYQMSDLLFPKYTGRNTSNTVDGMRKMLKRLSEYLHKDYPELYKKHYGTHSLRKTMPREVLDNTTDVKEIMTTSEFLAHSDMKVTSRYLNIHQEQLDNFAEKYGIGI